MTTLPLWAILFLVGVAGALGALVRHAVMVVGAPNRPQTRRRIIGVNTAGAFFAGVLLALDTFVAGVVAVGVFGALTTFSTVALWVADDLGRRQVLAAVRLVAAHLLLGIPAVIAGFLFGGFFF